MRFHLHIVDGDAPLPSSPATTSLSSTHDTVVPPSSAALLFAHMTLRCGHLGDVVVVSASTTPAAARQAQLQTHQQQLQQRGTMDNAGLSFNGNTPSEDAQVLQCAAAVLDGRKTASEMSGQLPFAPHVLEAGTDSADTANLVPVYKYFSTPFSEAELSLRRAVAIDIQNQCEQTDASLSPSSPLATTEATPYFDLIATTDLVTFDYIIDYYQQQRVRHGGCAMHGLDGRGRGMKPVGVFNVVSDDPSRGGRVLQRVLEMILRRSGWSVTAEAEAEEEEGELAAAAQPIHEEEESSSSENGEHEEKEGNERDEQEDEGAAAPAATTGMEVTTSGAATRRRGGAGGVHGRSVRYDGWVNHIDEAVHLFAQLFGVDVLVALV